MESQFLQDIGLGGIDAGVILFIFACLFFVLIIVCVVLGIELKKLRKRFEVFSGGRDAHSLEHEVGEIFKENRELKDQTERNRKDIRVLYRNMENAIQRVGLIKYDAFEQMGGKLSFALALLDEKNNGFIINSVRGTEGGYTFSKEIKGGICDLALGKEEAEALNTAMKIK